ncbi:MAG: hydroxyethylthiazole kinase, partial [Streptococcus salivarius]|nr:hydroxyethylthiazole kinase [Streptococcus salivarius]
IIDREMGLEDFRLQTLNQLSLLKKDANWLDAIKGGYYA